MERPSTARGITPPGEKTGPLARTQRHAGRSHSAAVEGWQGWQSSFPSDTEPFGGPI